MTTIQPIVSSSIRTCPAVVFEIRSTSATRRTGHSSRPFSPGRYRASISTSRQRAAARVGALAGFSILAGILSVLMLRLCFGVFSGHAIYLPELFPTHVRATAVSFCNGTGRVITSFGPLVAGLLVVPFGSFNNAAAFMTCFAVLSIIAMMIGRETRDDALPR